jgi:enoyl-CoA hydratase/carnithine racemase
VFVVNLKEEMNNSVVTITFDRPQSLNSLDIETGRQLLEALRRCSEDSEVRAVVLRGEGRAFCSGGDINMMQQAIGGGPDGPGGHFSR